MIRDEMEGVSAVRHGLMDRLGRERFDLWFSTLVSLQWRQGRLHVIAADEFLLDRLRKQFGADIAAVVREKQPDADVAFEVDRSLKAAGISSVGGDDHAGQRADPKACESKSGNGVATSPVQPAVDSRPPSFRRKFARLESFVVGDGNRVAYTAARSVVQRPGTVSPLFVYGPPGGGKTHLLEGIWSAMRYVGSSSRVLFLSAEQFTSHFLESLRGGGLPSFRRKCRVVDLLVVDDVQFFVGKRATVIELQHTMDALQRSGKQLVLAADRPPSELSNLGSELIARFSGGLICSVEEPDYETRLGVARQFARRMREAPADEILEMIAAEMGGDARQIAGALNRLEATSLALHQPLTLHLARTTLHDVFRATQRVVRLADIEQAVCDTFGLDPKSLRTRTKAKSVSHPRMLAMWLARKYTQSAFTEISEYFGRRSHSTVISAEKRITRWVADGSSMQLGHEAWKVQDAIRRVELRLRTGS